MRNLIMGNDLQMELSLDHRSVLGNAGKANSEPELEKLFQNWNWKEKIDRWMLITEFGLSRNKPSGGECGTSDHFLKTQLEDHYQSNNNDILHQKDSEYLTINQSLAETNQKQWI